MRLPIFVVILMAMLLQGCMNVATSGAQAVYNQRNIKKTLTDQYIAMRAFQSMHHNTHDFDDTNISISAYNGDVLLAGEVPEAWQRAKAEYLVKQIPDVKEVYNLVRISSPSSALTRVSDAWITAKVKAKLIASEDLDATQIKVVTENGTVYLMGLLQAHEAEAAAEIASNTDGVQRVVKVFSYMTITKQPAGQLSGIAS